jgi:hypothetical protein
VEQSKTQNFPETLASGAEGLPARIDLDSAAKPVAARIWHALIVSPQEQKRLATTLSTIIGDWWWIDWKDDSFIVRRQLVGPPGTAFGTPSVRGPSLGSPELACDGQSIVIDREPKDYSVLDDLAYVAAKIARLLGWIKVSVGGSPQFQQRFKRYALLDTDFYSWTEEMAQTLRQRQAGVDWEGIAEELEDLGKSQEAALKSHLQVLLAHLLKWAYQSDHRGKSWRRSIGNSRDEVIELLDANPGLRRKLDAIFASAYRKARRDAAAETDLEEDSFPIDPPWSFSEAISEDFLPAAIGPEKGS